MSNNSFFYFVHTTYVCYCGFVRDPRDTIRTTYGRTLLIFGCRARTCTGRVGRPVCSVRGKHGYWGLHVWDAGATYRGAHHLFGEVCGVVVLFATTHPGTISGKFYGVLYHLSRSVLGRQFLLRCDGHVHPGGRDILRHLPPGNQKWAPRKGRRPQRQWWPLHQLYLLSARKVWPLPGQFCQFTWETWRFPPGRCETLQ